MRYLIIFLLIFGCAEYEGPTTSIGSFNIQVFGVTKRQNTEVMEILSDIACKYDILAIQELRDKTETTAGIFVKQINEKCQRDFIMSKRLGRSNSKENYAIIYDNVSISVIDHNTYPDTDDVFEREPQIAVFNDSGFVFTVVNIHVKPDDASEEINALADIVEELDGSVIVLGDLNADCGYFHSTPKISGYNLIIPDHYDTTISKSNCAYDRIFTRNANVLDKGIFHFDEIYSIEAGSVSDHYPVFTVLAHK